MQDGPSSAHALALVALDLGTLLGAGMTTLVSGCRNRLELEQEVEGDPGYTGCPGNVAVFLPSQAVRRMRMKAEGR